VGNPPPSSWRTIFPAAGGIVYQQINASRLHRADALDLPETEADELVDSVARIEGHLVASANDRGGL